MRPLIVLILVLAAAAALVLGFNLLDKGPDNDAGVAAPTGGAEPGARSSEQATLTTPKDAELPERSEAVGAAEAPGVETTDVAAPLRGNGLVGQVVDDKQQPVANATLKLSRDPMMGEAISMVWFTGKELTGKSVTATTDAQGRFRFKGIEPARDYFLLASHPDYSSVQEEHIAVGAQGEATAPTIVLSPGSTLSGYVQDIGGAPLSNATLHLDSAYMMGVDQRSPDRMTTTTDGTGYYEFKNVAGGPRNLTVTADGFGLQIKHNLMFKGQAGDDVTQEFRLQPGHPIAGVVLGPQQEPVVGAEITALNYGNNTSSRGDAVSAEDGSFQIDGLQQGSYVITVNAKGYRQGRLNRIQAGDVNVTIDMMTKACVSGRVVDASGAAVPTFTLTARRTNLNAVNNPAQGGIVFENTDIAQSYTDTDGSFELCGFMPGMAYAIHATAPGFAPAQTDVFQVQENQPPAPVQVRLSRGGSIEGRVVDASGAPVSGAQVSSHDTNYNDSLIDSFLGNLVTTKATERKARTDAEGYFKLELLTPGAYKVHVTHPAHTAEVVRDIQVGEGKPAEVGPIQLGQGGTITGKVYDQAGNALGRGFIQLVSTTDPSFTYQARTDAEGRYQFEHVRPGGYKLSATRVSPTGGGDAFNAILDQQHSEVAVNVLEGGTVQRDLSLGN